MKLPSELKAYFSNVATQLGMSFEYGNSQRIINRQSGRLDYPLLWLEKPTVRREESGAYKLRLVSGFAILISVKPDDYEGLDEAQDEAFKLTEKVLFRLENDADLSPPIFEFDRERTESDVIEYWSGDSDTGWRTGFEVKIQGGCADDFYAGEIYGTPEVDMWGAGGGNVIGHE